MPPYYNAYTQIKQKTKIVNCMTSTQVEEFHGKSDTNILDIKSYLNISKSTQVVIKEDDMKDNSTWLEFIDENFDITSKISYSKIFKVKAKIKTISKFIPKINIE